MRRALLALILLSACGGSATQTRTDHSTGTQAAASAISADEAALMKRMRESLANAPQTTVDLADEGDTRWPDSTQREDREALAIDALIKLQKIGAARDRADRFLRRYPNSTHAAHIANMTGVHVTPSGPGAR